MFSQCEFDNRRFEGVARRATPSKRRFFVGVGAAPRKTARRTHVFSGVR